MKKSLLLAAVIGFGLLTGCGSNEYKPVAINQEVDKCDVCNMQVGDNPYAVEAIMKDGKSHKFDDIGCLNEWKKENGTENIAIQFVRDHNNKKWLKLNDAYYVYDESFSTPMAYGVYSFRDKASAEKFIEQQGKGKLMTADDLESHTWARNKHMMKHMMKHGMDSEANHEKSGMNSEDTGMNSEDKGMHK